LGAQVRRTYTVPTSGLYNIIAVGAGGGVGADGSFPGGLGAEIGGTFSLSAGETLQIAVGGVGLDNGGGGGGSFVVGPGVTPLVIAGGGGGGPNGIHLPASDTHGGDATGPMAAGGLGGGAAASDSAGGGGGLLTDGVSGGNLIIGPVTTFGGQGGKSFTDLAAGGDAYVPTGTYPLITPSPVPSGGFGGGGGGSTAGGGGGGYSGGEGGDSFLGGSGDGGTSFDGGISPFFVLGFERGDGYVTITAVSSAPEPSSLVLMGGCLAGFLAIRQRTKQRDERGSSDAG